MSKISAGILGGFSGKVGNVVGAKWKGIDTMKIKPSTVTNPKTIGQLDQRTRFSTILGFLKPMTEFVRVGFRAYAKRMSQFNAAMSYNLLNAISGTYPNYSVNFAAALVSRGPLEGVSNGAVTSTTAGSVVVTWSDNSGVGSALSSDKAMIVLYHPLNQVALTVIDGPDRSVETATVAVPLAYSGDTLQAYLAFKTADGGKVSNSSHLGSVTVAS